MENLLDSEMDLISPADISMLCRTRSGPCVSIFMPTHRVRQEERHDRLRFRNLLATAAEELAAVAPEVATGDVLSEAQWLLGNSAEFWRHQAETLAVFMAPGETYWYRLSITVAEFLSVGDTFHVAPLIRVMDTNGHFFVLTLSSNSTRLFEGSRYQMMVRDLANTPTSLTDVTRYDVQQPYLQIHTGTPKTPFSNGGSVVFHGHGEAADRALTKMRTMEYLRQLENGVRHSIGSSQAPLVLVGQPTLVGQYREVNQYPFLLEEALMRNPRDLSLSDLHDQVWPLLSAYQERSKRRALEELSIVRGHASNRVSTVLKRMADAAEERRIKTLFVRSEDDITGRPDSDGQKSLTPIQSADETQLLDRILARTLDNGGDVYIVGDEVLPGHVPATALFRY